MKRNLLHSTLALLLLLVGGVNVMALETYDFQELCMALGKGGPWAVNDGGDAGFTLGTEEAPITMHFLGDYTEQGFSWNQRFAYEYVDGRGKFTMRNKSNKKDKNCGMFSWDYSHCFSILGLKDGDKVTITTLAGTTTFVSTNVTAEVNEGDVVASGTAYTISTTEETTRLDIQMASATLISKIEIEPYGVETVPVITVTPKTLKLIPTATAKLAANVSPSADTQWSSSDESVATVAEDGTVTAVAAGTATISNSWKSEISDAMASDACEVIVADIDLSAYTLANSYDFTTMGDVELLLQEEAAGAIWNDANSKTNNVFFCTNEGLELLAVQAAVSGNKGWSIVDGQGLFLASGAGRCAAIAGIKTGQVVEFIYTGDGFFTRSDDDGIEKTALNEGVGRAIYLAEEDGMIGFELVKGNAVKEINIYEAAVTATKTITLDPGVWEVDGAVFATYAFNDKDNAWFPFEKMRGDAAYVAQIPDIYTGIILVRLMPATAEGYDADNNGLNWNNRWNQTDDIAFGDIADQTTFTITGWGEGEGAKSTYTAANAAIEALKAKLAKVISLASLLDIDTADAEALLANPEATEEQLSDALKGIVEAAVPKAQELVTLAKKFFDKFDPTAGAALAPYFAAAETALAGTDIEAMYTAAMALFAQVLTEGQRAMAKVNDYLQKMENETVNADIAAINAAVVANDLNAVLAALGQLKNHLPEAAQAYVLQVQALIEEGQAAGKDVSGMSTALTNVMTAYLQFTMEKADFVDMGYALYQLIKAVEAYKATLSDVAEDIAIYPTGGDIAAALEEAKAKVAKVGNITINLAVDGDYTLGATLTAPNSIFIYGNEGTVTVAEEMTGDFITLNGTEVFAMKSETEASDHYLIPSVEIRGLNLKGLKGSLVKDAQKTLVENLVIDWSNIEMPAAGKNVLDFNGKGYAGKVTVTQSTIWANGMNTGFFAQYGSRPKNINGDWLQEFDIEKSTFVNIANGKNVCDLKQNGTAQNVYTLKNNIFVDCGKSGQTVVGFNKGQTSATPAWDVTGNYFEWGGVCANAAETEKAGQKNEENIVKDCVEGKLTFADAAAGDFNGEFELAEGTAPDALGAPYWTINFKSAPVAGNYYLVGNMTGWAAKEEYKLTLNTEAETEEYMITVELAADAQFKIAKSDDGITIADEDWYPSGMGNSYGEHGEITAAGIYTVYFRPNADGGEDWFNKVIYVQNTSVVGISSLTTQDTQLPAIYNMNGQRVTKAQKGFYIINGKKVVLK